MGITFAITGALVLYTYHQELKERLDQSLERLAKNIIANKLYEYTLSQVHKEIHRVDLSDPLYENLTLSYHPTHPAPVAGTGVVTPLPDGRFLTVTSSLGHVDARTYSLAKELMILFGTLFALLGLAYALFLHKRSATQE